MEAIDFWKYIKEEAQPILDIRVVDGYSNYFVHFNNKEVGGIPMGQMVENRHLRIGLLKKAKELTSLKIYDEVLVKEVKIDAYKAEVTLSDDRIFNAPLLIASDGRHSKIRSNIGIKTLTKHYKQTAIVCVIEHEIPHEGLAIQRFFPVGPFAALPMQNNRSCLVWSEDKELAPHLLNLPEAEFINEISKRLGNHLGKFKVIGKRFSYPLNMILAREFISQRFALVGDSAHGIHPIAGQGVNVGFRDVAVMVQLIAEAMKLGQDIGSNSLLRHYQQWRRFDAMSMGLIMDSLTSLFSNDITLIRKARDAGLDIVNKIPQLKRFFMRHAMGTLGELPEMMKKAG